MKKLAIALTAAAVVLGGTPALAKAKLTGEERLHKLLEGRVAGEPVNCISLSAAREARIIDKTAIVYDAGSVIYVNRPHHPDALDSDDVMVTKPTSGQLCRLDTVQMRDRSQMWFTGFVGLDQFVPYRRVASRN